MTWTLNLEAEAGILVPWLLTEPDPFPKDAVLAWLDEYLLKDPVGRGREEVPGVFSAKVPRTDVVLVWTLLYEKQEVVLALVGR